MSTTSTCFPVDSRISNESESFLFLHGAVTLVAEDDAVNLDGPGCDTEVFGLDVPGERAIVAGWVAGGPLEVGDPGREALTEDDAEDEFVDEAEEEFEDVANDELDEVTEEVEDAAKEVEDPSEEVEVDDFDMEAKIYV